MKDVDKRQDDKWQREAAERRRGEEKKAVERHMKTEKEADERWK